MKKYFLHNGTESSGPFDLEELKAKRITKNSPVWFEGLENWKTADEIPELKNIFVVVPPPIPVLSSIPPKPKLEKVEERKILGISKKTFFILLGSLVVLSIITVLNKIEDDRSRELEIKNHKTEVENHQYELQQKEINEQKILLEEQEKVETERITRERKQTTTNRILEIQNLIPLNQENIEIAKNKLKEVSNFKVLRTADERKEQISLLQKEISDYGMENSNLNKELEKLKLELEKLN